jgi:hypothetical protein
METPLAEQSPQQVYAKEEQIISFVKAAYPNVDLSPGTALRDLVVKIYAHLETRIQEQIDLALVSSSLLEISKNPNVVDNEQVSRVLSNFNVERGDGATASGLLRLFLSSSISIVISPDIKFTLGGITFSTDSSYVLVNSSNFTGASSQRLIESSGSLFTVAFPVVASTPGSSGNVRASTVVSSITPVLSSVVSAKADSDFTGGADVEDNVTLLKKAKTGAVGKALSGRAHINAKLKIQFPEIKDVGVVGFLDPEMRRDLVQGVHVGNRVDLYIKSASYPSRVTEKMPMQMISYDNQYNKEAVFEVVLPPPKAAGIYTIESIRSNPTQLGSFELVSDIRTMQGNEIHYISDVETPAFTSYQNIIFRFKVPYAYIEQCAAPVAQNYMANWISTAPPPDIFLNQNPNINDFFYVYVEYLKMPNLSEVQAYVDSAEERSLSADMLVKAAIPIMCTMQMRLLKPSGAESPNINLLKSALVSKFNSFDMGKSIPASAMIHTAYQNIPAGYSVDLPLHMYGVVVNPDMSKDVMFSSDSLKPPKNYAKGVSGNTCAFFIETSLIDISIVECNS